MAAITLQAVTRVIEGTAILDDISFHVDDGQLAVIVGSSGAGKTAVIRAIAGLDELTSGAVLFDNEDVTKTRVAERDVSVVFQESTLFPTYTARGNVGFPLKVRAMRRDEINNRVTAEARALSIEHVLERWPRQLAAGHQQLVEIARALVRVPRVLLMDEPMANLDPPTRRHLRQELKTLQRGYGVTTVYATNDPLEAMSLADRIVAIDDGRVQQIGTPEELYEAPANTHIAWLTGPVSFVDATVERDADGFWLVGDVFRMRAWPPALVRCVRERVQLGLRPDSVTVDPASELRVGVESPSFEGGRQVSRIRLGSKTVAITEADIHKGDEIGIRITDCLVFDDRDQLVAHVGSRTAG